MNDKSICSEGVVRQMKHQSFMLKSALLIYIIAVLYITLLAWNYGASLGPAGPGGRNYNVIPFRSIYRIATFSPTIIDPIRILLGNVIMFVPLGFLLPTIWRNMRKQMTIVTIGFLFSFSIELSQFLFTHRVANIDDVILNSFGTWIGFMIFSFYLWTKQHVLIITK